jgi:hypothetical protein
MDQVQMEERQRRVEAEVQSRFPAGVVGRVVLLQYGDDPMVEPGELLVRVFIEPLAGGAQSREPLENFESAHRQAMRKLMTDLPGLLPEAARLQFVREGSEGLNGQIVIRPPAAHGEADRGGAELTPVMARLGPVDLETLDTLITAGIAANRAEAVRWALARIRERPAYAQLRERAREIERLKAEF